MGRGRFPRKMGSTGWLLQSAGRNRHRSVDEYGDYGLLIAAICSPFLVIAIPILGYVLLLLIWWGGVPFLLTVGAVAALIARIRYVWG